MYFLFYLKTKDCNTDTKKCSFAIIKVGHPCIYEIHKTHIEAPQQFSHLYKDGDKSCTCPDCKQESVGIIYIPKSHMVPFLNVGKIAHHHRRRLFI